MLPHVRETRKPSVAPPEGSCDCHFHVFGSASKYPPVAKRTYEPPDATFEQLEHMHRALGVGRGVIVQPAVYGVDNRLLRDTLRGRGNYRGVAAIDDSVSDADLRSLHEAGVRGARFNLSGVANPQVF